MRLVWAQYKGYDGKYFNFIIDKSPVGFFQNEITILDISLVQLVKMMSKDINRMFRAAVFWDTYGYYVTKNRSGVYEIFDALTGMPTGTTFSDYNKIPDTYMDKPLQKFQRKVLIGKLREKNV